MTSAAKRPIKDELNEAAARTAGLTFRSQAEEIDVKTMAMMVGTLMVSVGCATADPARLANNTAASTQPAVASAAEGAEGADGIRCEYRPVLGSRVGQKVCHSEEQWAAMERQAKQQMNDIEAKKNMTPYTDGDG